MRWIWRQAKAGPEGQPLPAPRSQRCSPRRPPHRHAGALHGAIALVVALRAQLVPAEGVKRGGDISIRSSNSQERPPHCGPKQVPCSREAACTAPHQVSHSSALCGPGRVSLAEGSAWPWSGAPVHPSESGPVPGRISSVLLTLRHAPAGGMASSGRLLSAAAARAVRRAGLRSERPAPPPLRLWGQAHMQARTIVNDIAFVACQALLPALKAPIHRVRRVARQAEGQRALRDLRAASRGGSVSLASAPVTMREAAGRGRQPGTATQAARQTRETAHQR